MCKQESSSYSSFVQTFCPEYWLVEPGMEYLRRVKIQKNISCFTIHVFIHPLPHLLSKGLGFACIDLVGGTIFTLKWNGWNRSVNCACYCIWSIGRTRSFYVENIHRKPYTKDSQRIRNGNGQYAANAAVPTLLASHWWLPPTDKMPSWGS